jgi:3-oxoacyl-(acyl-carrier-protein) synthase
VTFQPAFAGLSAARRVARAVIAAREAVSDAGVEWTPELRENAAIITGSCVGGQSTEDIGFQELYKLGHGRVHPLTIPKTMANAGARLNTRRMHPRNALNQNPMTSISGRSAALINAIGSRPTNGSS